MNDKSARAPGFYWWRNPTYTNPNYSDAAWTVAEIWEAHGIRAVSIIGWDATVDEHDKDAEWGPRIEPPK